MRIKAKYITKPLYYFYKLLCASLRIKEVNRSIIDELDQKKNLMVFSLWHDELFTLMTVKRQLQIFTLVSQSRDGEYLAGVLELLGLENVRGSSSRGGTKALLQAAKKMQNEHKHACLTVDGPRGPRHEVKQGAVFLASYAKAYIVPIRIIMHKSFRFSSWDKFQIPLPFSKVSIIFATPYQLTLADEDRKDFFDQESQKLNAILNGLAPND